MDHAATVTVDPAGGVRAECSCGEWAGPTIATGAPALREHLALSEWAAHVHVAEGLATPEG